jgi:hypothetical protein
MNDERDLESSEAREVERRAREVFASSIEQLDAATLSRLNRSRQLALDAVRAQPRANFGWSKWMPAGAAAAAALGAALLWNATLESPSPVARTAAVTSTSQQEPLELISANADDLQLATAEDDLDFYAWVSDATSDDDDAVTGEGQT